MSKPRKRLDTLLFELGLAQSRQKAQALVIAGLVTVNGALANKPGVAVADGDQVNVKGKDHPYVSRGGVKLAHALDVFHINPAGMTCLDIGSSTGGFTDCLLQRGAIRVFAVDVGDNQLDYRLRSDPRVVTIEGMNARNMDLALITDPIQLAVADVSFISLRLVIPPILPSVVKDGRLVLLVKPQFEAGRNKVGKGIVRDEKVHEEVLESLGGFFESTGLVKEGVCESPILGKKGNKEFFVFFLIK
jgi:23S rRNA (cytidine1920-2'-O)/16S rRNA (cytidine1409-2'-O)-methyltransferase